MRNRPSTPVRHIGMGPRSWIIAGWAFMAGTVGLAIAAIAQALGAVNASCLQPLVTTSGGLAQATCPGASAEFIRGVICGVLAGVAFFCGLACFFWAAHLRSLEQPMRMQRTP